jgi:hypothetical protein
LACLQAACAGGGNGGSGKKGGGGGGCVCDPPGCPTVSFNRNVQPIFNRSCATSGRCHGPNGAEDLDLTTGASRGNIVGVKSQESHLLRVKPGAPTESYLYLKMTESPPAIAGLTMPQGCLPSGTGGTPLEGICPSAGDVAAIEQWITECATDTPSLP